MKVEVRYFTTMRELAGTKEDELEMPEGSRLQDLIEKISSVYGKEAFEYLHINDSEEIDPTIKFLINGKSAKKQESYDTTLIEGDVVAIIPPIGGG